MAENIKLLVYPTKDVKASKAFFNTYLGTEPYVDGDYYVGYKTDSLEVGLDPSGAEIIAYIEVQNIKKSLQTLLDTGSSTHQDIKDVGGGMLIAQVKDTNGNVLGLRQLPK